MLSAVVCSLVIGIATAATRYLMPWVVGNAIVVAVTVAYGVAVGTSVFVFGEDLKQRFRARLKHRMTRAIAAILLVTEIPLTRIMAYTVRWPIVRVVPGPRLAKKLGLADEHQQFRLCSPTIPRSPFRTRRGCRYTPAAGPAGVRYAAGAEKKEAREYILKWIVEQIYMVDEDKQVKRVPRPLADGYLDHARRAAGAAITRGDL